MSERWRAPSRCNTSCQSCREPLLGLWGFAFGRSAVDKQNWSRWFFTEPENWDMLIWELTEDGVLQILGNIRMFRCTAGAKWVGGHSPVAAFRALTTFILWRAAVGRPLLKSLKFEKEKLSLRARFALDLIRDWFARNHKDAGTSKRPAYEDENNTESEEKVPEEKNWLSRGVDKNIDPDHFHLKKHLPLRMEAPNSLEVWMWVWTVVRLYASLR